MQPQQLHMWMGQQFEAPNKQAIMQTPKVHLAAVTYHITMHFKPPNQIKLPVAIVTSYIYSRQLLLYLIDDIQK